MGLSRTLMSRLSTSYEGHADAERAAPMRAYLRACWKKAPREYQYFALKYLRRWTPKVASPAFVDVLAKLISTRSWWDTVDDLAQHPVGSLVARHPSLKATMDEWAESDDLWRARATDAAAVAKFVEANDARAGLGA